MSDVATSLRTLAVGQEFKLCCLVKTHDVKVTGTGKAFVSAVLADVDCQAEAVQWDPAETDVAAYTSPSDVVEIHGKVGTYKNKMQLTIDSIRSVPMEQVDWAKVLPVCPRSEESLVKWLDECLKLLKPPMLGMVQQVTADQSFRYCPAASVMHHAYVHGLLEHTVDVARIVVNMACRGGFDLQIALAGALLHDVGKIYEYSMTGRRLPAAKTLGHSLMGCQVVSGVAGMHAVPADVQSAICHIIASHHGRREWGAVVEPATKEAWLVHAADLIDAKLACADTSVQE